MLYFIFVKAHHIPNKRCPVNKERPGEVRQITLEEMHLFLVLTAEGVSNIFDILLTEPYSLYW